MKVSYCFKKYNIIVIKKKVSINRRIHQTGSYKKEGGNRVREGEGPDVGYPDRNHIAVSLQTHHVLGPWKDL